MSSIGKGRHGTLEGVGRWHKKYGRTGRQAGRTGQRISWFCAKYLAYSKISSTRSMIHKGQAMRDDIKIARNFMGQLNSDLQNIWDSY